MEMKGIIENWFEEGFYRFKGAPEVKSRYDKSLIPPVTNDKGELITPKPLFTMFLKSSPLDPNFLVEYLEVIENALRNGRDKDLLSKEDQDISTNIRKKKLIEIEYHRKNIFLSRIIFPLFELPDHLVLKGFSDYDNVQSKNDEYKKALEFLRESIENSDDLCTQAGYVERVDKELETMPIIYKDQETVVNAFQMREHYNRKEVFVKPPPKTIQEYLSSRTKFRNSEEFKTNLVEYPAIIKRMQTSLYVIEKTLHYNTYKSTILSFNGKDSNIKDIMLKEEIKEANSSESQVLFQADLKHHLRFHIPSIKSSYRVTYIAFNPKNPSIFASSYGVVPSEEMECTLPGFVLVWNINKCEHPERIYPTPEVVTCMDFSKTKPYLVAVGMKYGLISTFDLRRSDCHSNNSFSKVRPTGTITSVRWMRKKFSLAGEAEVLLSISMNGSVTVWHDGRSLDGFVLRPTRRGESPGKPLKRLILAPEAAPLRMQVNPYEQEVFIVGTIEGQVLQMNFNNPEDYMHVYDCHNGPLSDVQWSPLVRNVFATCGSDGCLRVWLVGRQNPCRYLHLKHPVLGMAWSNTTSTLLAVFTKKILFVFDFSLSLHKPVVELVAEKKRFFTFVTFCPKNNWILVGRSDGVVNLYELTDIPELKMSQSEALISTFLPE